MSLCDFQGVTICDFLRVHRWVLVRLSVCLPGLVSPVAYSGSAFNCFRSGSVLGTPLSLRLCVSQALSSLGVPFCVWLRGHLGPRHSPEQAGPGWGEVEERGGKKEKDRTAVTVTPESRGAGSKREGAGGGRSGRHGRSG